MSQPEIKATNPEAARSGWLMVRLHRFVGRLQMTIPWAYRGTDRHWHRERLTLGFFMLDTQEWGYGCIWYDGPNHYIAAGRLAFGWGSVPPNRAINQKDNT